MTKMLNRGRVPTWNLADRLRKAREHAGLTQSELATEIGVAQRSVSAYEGGAKVKRPVLISWAIRCEVDPQWLERGTVPPENGPLAQLAELRTFNPKRSDAGNLHIVTRIAA